MLKFIYLMLIPVFIECQQYRYDYTYDKDSEGWFKVHHVPATWDEARIRCSLEGSVLASPISVNIISSMQRMMGNLTNAECGIFTGLHATYSKGDFHSIEGVPIARMPVEWMPNEPDRYNNNEDCTALTVNGKIADVNCSEYLPYICYKKGPMFIGLNECGTTDKEYKLNEHTGSCYKFHTRARTWYQAAMACTAEGGYLAIPNDDYEGNLFKDLFNQNQAKAARTTKYKDVIFLGFLSSDKNGLFTTIHGSPIEDNYSKWDPKQPDGNANTVMCGGMFTSGLLDDVTCANIAPFICEKSPNSLLIQ